MAPPPRPVAKVFWKVHRTLYASTRGRIGHRWSRPSERPDFDWPPAPRRTGARRDAAADVREVTPTDA